MAELTKKKAADYVDSEAAWKVAAWRFNNQTSGDVEACADATGLSRKEVNEWWEGVDVLLKANGGSHINFPHGATPLGVGKMFSIIIGGDDNF